VRTLANFPGMRDHISLLAAHLLHTRTGGQSSERKTEVNLAVSQALAPLKEERLTA
jgi:hypothetical protein